MDFLPPSPQLDPLAIKFFSPTSDIRVATSPGGTPLSFDLPTLGFLSHQSDTQGMITSSLLLLSYEVWEEVCPGAGKSAPSLARDPGTDEQTLAGSTTSGAGTETKKFDGVVRPGNVARRRKGTATSAESSGDQNQQMVPQQASSSVPRSQPKQRGYSFSAGDDKRTIFLNELKQSSETSPVAISTPRSPEPGRMDGASTPFPNNSTLSPAPDSEYSGGRGISRSSSVSTVVYVGTAKTKQGGVGFQEPSFGSQSGASMVEEDGDFQEEDTTSMDSSFLGGLGGL